jgi:hypothetical protein
MYVYKGAYLAFYFSQTSKLAFAAALIVTGVLELHQPRVMAPSVL